MKRDSNILVLKYCIRSYRGFVKQTKIMLDFKNMIGCLSKGNPLSDLLRDEDKIGIQNYEKHEFKIKNTDNIEAEIKKLGDICKGWNDKYVEPYFYKDKIGNIRPVYDGYDWEVNLEYDDGSHKNFEGARSEPDNFNDFVKIVAEIVNKNLD